MNEVMTANRSLSAEYVQGTVDQDGDFMDVEAAGMTGCWCPRCKTNMPQPRFQRNTFLRILTNHGRNIKPQNERTLNFPGLVTIRNHSIAMVLKRKVIKLH